MAWKIDVVRSAAKEFKSLDKGVQSRLIGFLQARIAGRNDPREIGKALKGERIGLWAYRVGDYRIICQIDDGQKTVTVLRAAHRRHVYD